MNEAIDFKVRVEMRQINATHPGVWARRVQRRVALPDGAVGVEHGYAISHGESRSTVVQYPVRGQVTDRGAWRACKKWLASVQGGGV